MPATAAIERIVVQTTLADKRAITKKAKLIGLTVSELMRRSASAYSPAEDPELLDQLADEAKLSADRACAAMDEAIEFAQTSDAAREAREAKLRIQFKANLHKQMGLAA